MVLMSLSVLSILGTAIMSSAVMNLKVKMNDKRQKTSFYLSEAGLEEAYGIMVHEVDEAIKAGNKKVKDSLPKFISDERAKEHKEPIEDSIDSVFIDKDGSVNKENIKIKMQQWFAQGYTDYFNKKDAKDTSVNDLKEQLLESKNYSILDSNIDSSKPNIVVEKIDEYPNVPPMKKDIIQTQLDSYNENLKKYMEEDNNKFKFTLVSQFTHESINKQIKSTFSISIPEYNTPYYIGNEVLTLKENILWTNALISDKDIIITGNNVNVNGDIYAYGDSDIEGNTKKIYNEIEDEYKKNDKYRIENSGIIVGNDSQQGDLTVNGNVITGSYIQTKSNNSNITIKNGDVYCNSLVIPDSQENCDINIGEEKNTADVNTIDDIELNGKKSHINIYGSYYGFSDGSHSDTHEESSSIVINSDDIGEQNGSSIKITGKYTRDSKDIVDNIKGTFIGGTVYINLVNGDYQTGESVSVKGNYRAYTEKIEDTNSEYYYSNDKDQSKVSFKYRSPLTLVHKKDGTKFQANKLAKYIKEIDTSKGTNFLNLGNGNIDIENVKYSIGAYIDNESKLNESTSGSLDYETLFKEKFKEYKHHVNTIGDSQISLDDNQIDSKLNIEDRFDFKKDIVKNKENKEIYIANSNQNQSIYIVGPDSSESRSDSDYTIQPSDGVLKGIIVTKGDVYISGKINFTGMIVAKGNIYIQDDEEKIFTNDYKTNFNKNYVINKIAEDIKIITEGTQIGDLFTQDSGWSKEINVYLDNMGVDSDIKAYYKFSDLINITDWKKIKN